MPQKMSQKTYEGCCDLFAKPKSPAKNEAFDAENIRIKMLAT